MEAELEDYTHTVSYNDANIFVHFLSYEIFWHISFNRSVPQRDNQQKVVCDLADEDEFSLLIVHIFSWVLDPFATP